MSVSDTMKRSSKTDWEQLAKMPDEEIDYSDIPPLPETFFKRARVWHPESKVKVTVEVDSDILEWFKTEDADWQARMETALRLYVEAHKAYRKKSAVAY